MVAVVAAASFDPATRIVFEWVREAGAMLEAAGLNVMKVYDVQCVPEVVQPLLAETDGFALLMGHGFPDVWSCFNLKPVLKTCSSDAVLRGHVVYALSCYTAKRLGPDAVRKGAVAYIGFDDEFVFNTYDADIFKRQALSIVEALASGATTCEAVEHFRRVTEELINEVMRRGDVAAPLTAAQLMHNARHLRHHGECARIREAAPVRAPISVVGTVLVPAELDVVKAGEVALTAMIAGLLLAAISALK